MIRPRRSLVFVTALLGLVLFGAWWPFGKNSWWLHTTSKSLTGDVFAAYARLHYDFEGALGSASLTCAGDDMKLTVAPGMQPIKGWHAVRVSLDASPTPAILTIDGTVTLNSEVMIDSLTVFSVTIDDQNFYQALLADNAMHLRIDIAGQPSLRLPLKGLSAAKSGRGFCRFGTTAE